MIICSLLVVTFPLSSPPFMSPLVRIGFEHIDIFTYIPIRRLMDRTISYGQPYCSGLMFRGRRAARPGGGAGAGGRNRPRNTLRNFIRRMVSKA